MVQMPYSAIDLTRVRTYSLVQRPSLVALENMILPETPPPLFDEPELVEVAERIVAARQAGRPVIWMIGAHVVKRGLSPVLIDLMERGIITHLASNGAMTIHDFEIALLGNTSEDVATSLEDGSFGMAQETGAFMNRAVRAGARDGLGIGEALGRWIAQDDRFRFRDHSLVYTAYRLGIPCTVHVAIGTDIIHQHPECDFAALGWASGQDFKIFTASVGHLEGGVFCNFGSAVIGPEVFLKALSIARNLGHTVDVFTTANFDLVPLEPEYRRPSSDDQPTYYYRPKKNIVIRPTSKGGRGYHIVGDHRVTVPNLYHQIRERLGEAASFGSTSQRTPLGDEWPAVTDGLATTHPAAAGCLRDMVQRQPALQGVIGALTRAFRTLMISFSTGGTLFLCGNGGSLADALHISGELLKSYAQRRVLPDRINERLAAQADGEVLARNLEPGLRAVVLGVNPSLASAVANDMPDRGVNLAQELLALARPGDVLLGISTSGNARNVAYAAQTARALGLTVIALTGEGGGRLAPLADVAVCVPARRTDRIQELHVQCYHTLCEMLESELFESDTGG
jgi:phosphoheptose isomerase